MKDKRHIKRFNESEQKLRVSSVVIENKTNGSVLDDTFTELDKKFEILNKETKDWLKQKIMWHISEAYERSKSSK